jgi:hypothetical protein
LNRQKHRNPHLKRLLKCRLQNHSLSWLILRLLRQMQFPMLRCLCRRLRLWFLPPCPFQRHRLLL